MNMNKDEMMYKVKNRSASRVVYKDPELKLRREFAPGETKIISYAELEKLSYIPGGRAMMANFLQLEPQIVAKVGIEAQPEYFMSEAQIEEMLLRGSLDQFLDCLDFAPEGVLDLVKQLSIKLPLTDINKRRAMKEKLGYDVDAALRHIEEEYQEAKNSTPVATRRVREQPSYAAATPATRRTAVSYESDELDMSDVSEADTADAVVEEAPRKKRGRKPSSQSQVSTTEVEEI